MRTLSLLIVPLLLAAPSWAQTETLKGRVLDSTGAVIPGALVTAYAGEAIVAETRTGNGGEFELSLSPGEYQLQVAAPDFEPYTEVIAVHAGILKPVVPLEQAVVPNDPGVFLADKRLQQDGGYP